jgi:hypothetical protein
LVSSNDLGKMDDKACITCASYKTGVSFVCSANRADGLPNDAILSLTFLASWLRKGFSLRLGSKDEVGFVGFDEQGRRQNLVILVLV